MLPVTTGGRSFKAEPRKGSSLFELAELTNPMLANSSMYPILITSSYDDDPKAVLCIIKAIGGFW